MLRRGEAEEPGDRQSLVDRHHAVADSRRRRSTRFRSSRMAYGLSASAEGDIFPWMFNPPVTYWDGVSEILKYIGGGSIDGLKGKNDRLSLFRRRRSAASRSRCFQARPQGRRLHAEALSRGAGRHAEPVGEMARHPPRQARLRRHVRVGRDERRRDQGSDQDRTIPMDKFVSIWWPGDSRRCRPPATARRASRSSTGTASAPIIPRFRTSRSSSSTPARARPSKDEFGGTLYDHGVYNSMLIAEAIANAQKLTGKKVVTGEDVRRGLETINLDAARFEGDRSGGFRGAAQAVLRRPQQPQRDLRPAMGRRQMGEGQRPDHAGQRTRCSR